MRTKIAIAFTLITLLAGFIAFKTIRNLRSQNRDLKQNVKWITRKNENYKVFDSLNAISVQQLNLTLRDYERLREEEYELIINLKADKKRLKSITSSQTETIYNLTANRKDSIVYRDSIRVDTIKCWVYKDKWISFDGCEIDGRMETKIISRDSLIYVEHIVPRCFLFFKWGQKERKQDIISKNPNTKIIDAEFITIRK